MIIPRSHTVIESNDHVVFFLPNKRLVREVEKLFRVSATFFEPSAMRDLFPVLRVLGMLMCMFRAGHGAARRRVLVAWRGERVARLSAVHGRDLGAGPALVAAAPPPPELQPRHGVILVTLVWVLLPLACQPAAVAGHGAGGAADHFTHAYFEAVSGLTTTGSTVLSGLDALPLSVNIWRTFCSGWAAWAS